MTDMDVRAAIQASNESLRAIARRYGVNIKTVIKWRKRTDVADGRRGRPGGAYSAMTRQEEATATFIRRHTLLPLDDCAYALSTIMPHVGRTALYRCFTRYRIGALPADECRWVQGVAGKPVPLGCIKMDICPIPSAEGPVYLYFAIDLYTRYMHSAVFRQANAAATSAFIASLADAYPNHINRLITRASPGLGQDARPSDGTGSEHARLIAGFCENHGIELITADTDHPWSAEQIKQMDSIHVFTPDISYYPTRTAAADSIHRFDVEFNFGRRLKSLRGQTPFQFICQLWQRHPVLFRTDPWLMKPSQG